MDSNSDLDTQAILAAIAAMASVGQQERARILSEIAQNRNRLEALEARVRRLHDELDRRLDAMWQAFEALQAQQLPTDRRDALIQELQSVVADVEAIQRQIGKIDDLNT